MILNPPGGFLHFLIYGEDTFRSRLKLKIITQKYVDTNLGDTNLAQIDGAKAKGDEIIRSLWAMPFLAPKRLVIIHNLLSLGSKDAQTTVQDFLPKIPATTIPLFYETEKIDKRGSLYKILNQPKFSEEFTLLDPFKLRRFALQQFEKSGITIEPAALEYLLKTTSSDLWRLQNEIYKLEAYSKKLNLSDVQNLIHSEPSGDVFQLIDALARRDIKSATHQLKGRLNDGDNPIYLLSMFVYGFRTLLIVQDSLERNPKITTIPGIHPLVFKKSQTQVKNFTSAQLRSIYQKLRDLDYDIKTGIIDAEVALDLFIFDLCVASQEGKNEQLRAH